MFRFLSSYWMTASAGMTTRGSVLHRHSHAGACTSGLIDGDHPDLPSFRHAPQLVIPASPDQVRGGIQKASWIPVSAGMTNGIRIPISVALYSEVKNLPT
jgi:hypothetical protein